MSSPREAQLPLLLSISEGLSRGTDEMLRVSPQGDAMHPPSCSLAIRESVEEIKWLRAEVERLARERDALKGAAREYLETLGGAMKSGKFEMGGTAEMAHFVRQAMQKLDSLVFDRSGPRPAGLEKLHEPHGRAS